MVTMANIGQTKDFQYLSQNIELLPEHNPVGLFLVRGTFEVQTNLFQHQ